MRLFYYFFFFVMTYMLSSCSSHRSMYGLWEVDRVEVGDRSMTPVSKWTRLNRDYSYESGNGWKQHSVGTWNVDTADGGLVLESENGVPDEFGAFERKELSKDKMIWSRMEGPDRVTIYFERIDKIPTAPSDRLLGLWEETSEGESQALARWHFRWDQILVLREGEDTKKYAQYQTHGHKQRLQIIFYGDPLKQETWNYRFDGEYLVLESGSNDSKRVLKFRRVQE